MKLNDKELMKAMQADSRVATEGSEMERLDYLDAIYEQARAATSIARQQSELAHQLMVRAQQFNQTVRITALQRQVGINK